MARPNWGRGLAAFGNTVQNYYGNQMQQEREDALYQQRLADQQAEFDRQQAARVNTARELGQVEMDMLNQRDPLLASMSPQAPISGIPGIGSIDTTGYFGALSGVPGARQSDAIDLAMAREKARMGLERAAVEASMKPPKVERPGEGVMFEGVITPNEQFIFGPGYEPAVSNEYARMLEAGAPKNISTLQAAEDAVRATGMFAPSFNEWGQTQYDPVTGTFFDPTIGSYQEGNRGQPDWQPGWLGGGMLGRTYEFKRGEGVTKADAEARQPMALVDYYQKNIEPFIKSGDVTTKEVKKWLNEMGIRPEDIAGIKRLSESGAASAPATAGTGSGFDPSAWD